ncbi:YadA C-terminal domain-containing protein [Vibrio amylolyticus]|uniref:YadA C-terminal domain-containing protein n=1 Tax=Vibrio amylolyticus TaxID=2847292 RepID=UPI0035535B4E
MKKQTIALALLTVMASGTVLASETPQERQNRTQRDMNTIRSVLNEEQIKDINRGNVTRDDQIETNRRKTIENDQRATNGIAVNKRRVLENKDDITEIKRNREDDIQKQHQINRAQNRQIQDNKDNQRVADADRERIDGKVDANKGEIDMNKSNIDRIDSENRSADKVVISAAGQQETFNKDVETYAESTDARLNSLDTKVNNLENAFQQQATRINENEGKMSNGIAGVAAMANMPLVPGATTIGAGVGHFNGSDALAIGVTSSFGETNQWSVKASGSYAEGKYKQKDFVVGAGVGYSF